MAERIDMGINLFVRNWCAQHQSVTRRELRKLAAEVLVHHGLDIAALRSEFGNRTRYPERPMFKFGGENDEPTIWLLGWRKGDWTPIHDHEQSEAAIHVVAGEITHRIYWPTAEFSKNYRGPAVNVSQELHEGSGLTIPTPYIHAVGTDGDEVSTTLHLYYPPLRAINFYTEVEGNGLEWQGNWIEGQEPTDPDECGGCKTWGAKLCNGSCNIGGTENGKEKEAPLDPDAGRPRAYEPVSKGQTPGWGFV